MNVQVSDCGTDTANLGYLINDVYMKQGTIAGGGGNCDDKGETEYERKCETSFVVSEKELEDVQMSDKRLRVCWIEAPTEELDEDHGGTLISRRSPTTPWKMNQQIIVPQQCKKRLMEQAHGDD